MLLLLLTLHASLCARQLLPELLGMLTDLKQLRASCNGHTALFTLCAVRALILQVAA
jgi:hypothetical protein